MISGISIVCFSASYAVALALEMTRVLFRTVIRRVVLWIFLVAGLFAHTGYLVHRAQEGLSLRGAPLSNWYDWCLIAAWFVAAGYFLIALSRPTTTSGVFLLPMVLALVGVSCLFPPDQTFPPSTANRAWGMVHAFAWGVGTATVSLGFAAGVMYLLQSYRLKRKIPMTSGFRLPSLEWLGRLNERSLIVSSVLLAGGWFSGIVLNLIQSNQQGVGFPWSDPVVWTSGLLFLWLVAASLFSCYYRPVRMGRKVAYLTVANFVFLVFVLAIVFWSPTDHARDRSVDNRTPRKSTPLTWLLKPVHRDDGATEDPLS